MATVKVSQKGWVVIPAELRRKYGWKPGDRVRFVDYGGGISLVRVMESPEDETMGILKRNPSGRKGPKGSLTKALERERAKERRREDRR